MNVDSPEYQRASAAHLKHIAAVVRCYNEQHSGWMRAAARVKGEDQELASLQDIHVQLAPVLDVCGLVIEEVEIDQTYFSKDETIAVTELRANIVHKQTFVRYLNGIDRDVIDEDAYRALKWFSDQTIQQLAQVYDLNDPSGSEFLDCISSLNAIIVRYNELDPANDHNLKTQVKKLESYRDAAQQNYLREYITAERHHLFEEVGKTFNASYWHADSDSEQYHQRWNEVTADVVAMKKNPHAKEFVASMIAYLLRCIEFAREDIQKNEGSEFPYRDKHEKLISLDTMEDRLLKERDL